MKGFVPVTKANLREMLTDCLEAIELDYQKKVDKRIERFIEYERERITTRKWYRLFMLPKARFSFDTDSIQEYTRNRDYAMFEADPFEILEKDKNNSIKWVNSLMEVAKSGFAGEPIQLDMKTFKRISNSFKYHWVNIGICYTMERG